MKLLYISFLIVGASCFYVDNSTDAPVKEKIVGGKKAPIMTLPYQAQLLENNQLICGGTIISKLWVLTAAHCIRQLDQKFTVITGSPRPAKGRNVHEVSKIITHPEYDLINQDNDIALLKLSKPIYFNEYQKPIKLASKLPKTGDIMTISGFGKEGEYLDPSGFLKVANVPVIDHNECVRRYYEEIISNNMMCAGEGKTDACEGDSGGPGIIDAELAGIVSAGMDCGSKVYPGIYTIVYNYRNWILQNTKSHNDQPNISKTKANVY